MPETILLVDDNSGVLDLLGSALRNGGYDVLEAASAEQARHVFGENRDRIKLLVCDIVLPGLSGPHLAELLTQTAPNLRLLFMSGYKLDHQSFPVRLSVPAGFLHKPFTLSRLFDRVEHALTAHMDYALAS
jgi:DNA-binding NtrC family response regulator